VGVGLDLRELRRLGHAVVLISNISVLVPLERVVAGVLSYPACRTLRFPSDIRIVHGTAMSITAFPVLARILEERNLLQSPVGIVAISCAAVDDITAWCFWQIDAWVRSELPLVSSGWIGATWSS